MILLFLFNSCNNLSWEAKKSKSDTVFWATDYTLSNVDIYSNNSFSSFIKDFIFDPIFYYDDEFKEVKSSIISNIQWKNEREVILTVNTKYVFHNSNYFSKRKGRFIQASDISHSIELFRKHSKYLQVKDFLSHFKFKTIDKNQQLSISFDKNIQPEEVLFQLSQLRIPLVPEEIKEIQKITDFVGTGIYTLDHIDDDFIYFSLFKNHPSLSTSKANNLPEKHIIRFGLTKENIYQEYSQGVIDAVITNDIERFTHQVEHGNSLQSSLFIRKEDFIHYLFFNPKEGNDDSFEKKEYILGLLNPDDYNQNYHGNQLITYYSLPELTYDINKDFDTLSILLRQKDKEYTDYVLSNSRNLNISIDSATESPDAIVLTIPTASNNEKYLTQIITEEYNNIFHTSYDFSKGLSQKLYQSATYILTKNHIRMINENFTNRNDFSTLYINKSK